MIIILVFQQGFWSPNKILMIWQHEVRRVLSDRLITHEEKSWFGYEMNRLAEVDLNEYDIKYISEEVFVVDFLK